MIKAVLADIDNTFIDFPAGASLVVEETFRQAGLGFTDEVLEVYNSVSKDVWGRLDRGELSHGDIVYGRWDMIFERLGIRYSSEKMEDIFETLLSETAVPEEGAVECAAAIAGKYPLYLASNSFAKDQERRMAVAGLAGYVSGYFLSTDVGTFKPHRRFFEYCAQRIGCAPSGIVMLGDSPYADTRVPREMGMRTILYDKRGLYAPGEFSDYVCGSLKEAADLILSF